MHRDEKPEKSARFDRYEVDVDAVGYAVINKPLQCFLGVFAGAAKDFRHHLLTSQLPEPGAELPLKRFDPASSGVRWIVDVVVIPRAGIREEADDEAIAKEEMKIISSNYNLLVERDRKRYIADLTRQMTELAKNLEFEKAALLRDEIQRIKDRKDLVD